MTTYTLISDYSKWGRGKTHIAKEHGTVNSMCGKSLGFNYTSTSLTGYEHGNDLFATKDEILIMKNICKVCLKKI